MGELIYTLWIAGQQMADTAKQSRAGRILVSKPTLTAVSHVFNKSSSMRKGKQEARRRKRGKSITSMMFGQQLNCYPFKSEGSIIAI